MNKIDELIKKLCKNGVENIPICDLIDYVQPTQYIVSTTKYDSNYGTPVLTAGKSFLLGNTNETNGIYQADKNHPVMIFDDFTTSMHWVDFPFKVKSSALKILVPSKVPSNFRYLYYVLKSLNYSFSIGNHERQWISKYSQQQIPVPPLEIQNEIVRILDILTELVAELELELEAELEARNYQYKYFLNLLFDENSRKSNLVTFEEIGTIERGGGIQRKDFCDKGIGCIHYGQIYTFYGTYTSTTRSFVSEQFASSLKRIHKGDIIIAVTGETVEDICKGVAWLGEEDIVTGGHTAILRHNQNAKYISYFLQSDYFAKQKEKLAHGTKVVEVTPSKLLKVRIPLPPLINQGEIVTVLDNLNLLTKDLTQVLYTEIVDRRRQYEYYRNKLLTF